MNRNIIFLRNMIYMGTSEHFVFQNLMECMILSEKEEKNWSRKFQRSVFGIGRKLSGTYV